MNHSIVQSLGTTLTSTFHFVQWTPHGRGGFITGPMHQALGIFHYSLYKLSSSHKTIALLCTDQYGSYT